MPTNISIASNEIAKTNGEIDAHSKKENILLSKRVGTIVDGIIPGNHAGASSGRMG